MHWFFKLLLIITLILVPFLVIFVFLPKVVPAKKISNAEISGLIVRSQEWSGNIRIKGDITTAFTTTVTLMPGTVVLVSTEGDKANIDYLPWHLKSGINILEDYHGVKVGEPFWDEWKKIQLNFNRLNAIGTKEQPIVIKSDTTNGSPYDFNAIFVKHGVLSNVKLSNYRRFELGKDVSVSDSLFSNTGECSICVTTGEPKIFKNRFERSLRESIWISQSSPEITDNLFMNLAGAGIRLDPKRFGQPTISYNTFEMPGFLALDVVSGGEDKGGIISNNFISGNSTIRLSCDTRLNISGNSILGQVSFKTGGCSGTYTFGSNYWGVPDLKTILSEKITHKEKTFQIAIPKFLDQPFSKVGIRTK